MAQPSGATGPSNGSMGRLEGAGNDKGQRNGGLEDEGSNTEGCPRHRGASPELVLAEGAGSGLGFMAGSLSGRPQSTAGTEWRRGAMGTGGASRWRVTLAVMVYSGCRPSQEHVKCNSTYDRGCVKRFQLTVEARRRKV